MLILADMPRAKAAKVLRCDEKSPASILTYWVSEAVSRQDMKDVKRLAIDETSRLWGHDSVTIVIDTDQRRVIDVEPTREKGTVTAFAQKFERHGGSGDAIAAVSSDMSQSYLHGIAENFPNAVSVIDRFHVKQVLIRAPDTVRKAEQQAAGGQAHAVSSRRLFMIPVCTHGCAAAGCSR